MSNNIFEKDGLVVTAFVGGVGVDMPNIQISISNDDGYMVLNNDDTLELIYALLSRVLAKPGYRATD